MATLLACQEGIGWPFAAFAASFFGAGAWVLVTFIKAATRERG